MGITLALLVALPAQVLLLLLAGRKDVVPPAFLAVTGYIAGLRITTVGRTQQGALLLANHISWLDILALAGTAKAIFVAHNGLAADSAFKWLCDQNDTIFITRDQRRSVAEQVDKVRAAIGRRPVTIFPEATTGDGKVLLPFRSSLLAAVEPMASEVVIQPVALVYSDMAALAWVGTQSGLANARQLLSRAGTIALTIYFLPPLAEEELADRKTMATAAQRAVEAILFHQK